jgi:hypothetical protein
MGEDGEAEPMAKRREAAAHGRIPVTAVLVAAVLLLGFAVGRAGDRDETIVLVKVSAADHEMDEGYFSLGDDATVMVKPGSDLYRFLVRQRGRKIKVTLTESAGPELSRLAR